MNWLQNVESAVMVAVALITCLTAVISTMISVLVYRRTRPNRTREAIDAALIPVHHQITSVLADVEHLRAEQGANKATIAAFDREIAERLGEIDDKVAKQSIDLERISVSLQHLAQNDQSRTLHHRITELAKAVSGLVSQSDAHGKQLALMHDFLLNGATRRV